MGRSIITNDGITIDGNEAAAHVAYHLSEVIAIYPITPSSPMGELSDAWASNGSRNIWGSIPDVTEMQSEGGAAGAVHGALQAGSLTTTFTASQGLLLMIPNMYKIAGELTPAVFHVAARSLASHALSIFGDHSDVMACRQTGFALLCSGSIQEVMDLSLIAHSASLKSRIPFLHFFDGFRSSHELMKIDALTAEQMRAAIDDEDVFAHRSRALTPDNPLLRGTAQNPDVFFQAREAINPFYSATPGIVADAMKRVGDITGRHYQLFDYVGAPDAERVIVIMGSGAEAAHECVDAMVAKGEKVGMIKVRLFRPFSIEHFISQLPDTVKSISVLDRTKEPGAIGEPLYQDVITALVESPKFNGNGPKVIGGRYGLSSKEFTPAMVRGVFDNLSHATPKNHFTVGIKDDVSNTSIDFDASFDTEDPDGFRGIFVGLGSDGTVGANKNSIKIIGEETDNFAQGYFVYDSKKSGSITKSHLRFGKRPIRSTYLIQNASFIACHQFGFLEKFDVLEQLQSGGTFLLNSPYPADKVWDRLPRPVQETLIHKQAKFYVIDAYQVARDTGMGVRINTVMQTCFFAIANILPRDEAIAKIKSAIEKTFGKRGEEVVQKNFAAVDQTIANLHEVSIPSSATSTIELAPIVSDKAPKFVREVTSAIMAGKGDNLPVSAMPVDGTFPTATAKWEKRNIAQFIPVWDPDICIQCGKCAMVCPHSVVRIKVYSDDQLESAPETFKSRPTRGSGWPDKSVYTIQMAPEDCTACELCVEVCPAKSKTDASVKALQMAPQEPLRIPERENLEFFEKLPEFDRRALNIETVRDSQVLQPLFEFSGACAGCGETPYVKLVSQLFGDRMVVANATGCSSIYGGNLPTTPWAVDSEGRGPAWSNSLFEDNAEFGLGMRLAINKKESDARNLLESLNGAVPAQLKQELLRAEQRDEAGIYEQRQRVKELKQIIRGIDTSESRQLMTLADYLVRKSVWIIGGDGWGYDIGYGGVDHVLASGHDVNILLLDTEVYSNTGGQMSKATPMGAIAKFAAAGKSSPKKDLGLLTMTYGNIYVARVAMGSNDTQTLRALIEAERYPGPSIVIAYSHCIAHGYNLKQGLDQQKKAVESGYWTLFRYNPELAEQGKNPLKLDSRAPRIPLTDYMYNETRFKMLTKIDPGRAKDLAAKAQTQVLKSWQHYKNLAAMKNDTPEEDEV